MSETIFTLWYDKDNQQQRNVIYQFKDEHHFLSNFYPCDVTLPAETIISDSGEETVLPALDYKSVENAYVAKKTLNHDQRLKVQLKSSGKAKRFTLNNDPDEPELFMLRTDWDDKKRIETMANLLEQKFSSRNPHLLEMLLSTGNTLLIEGNTWNDTLWGFDLEKGYGQNHLGRLLMEIREKRIQEIK